MPKSAAETPSLVFLPSDLLTPHQLAARLQVAVTWVYERSRKRKSGVPSLPVIKLGKLLRYNWPDVCQYLERARRA